MGQIEEHRSQGRRSDFEQRRWQRALFKLQVQETGWSEDEKLDTSFEARRRIIWRYIRKARRIAANTVRGEFPGDFTE